MRSTTKKSLAAAALGLGLVVAGTGAAMAGTTFWSYDYELPKIQLPGGGAYDQIKAISGYPGVLMPESIGGAYNANAKLCRDLIYDCGATVSNVYSYGWVELPNSIPAGTEEVNAQQWVSTYNFVNVRVTGWFASN